MIKDHSQYGATESQYLIQKRAIQPYKVICGIQTYIDYLHRNLLFFAPEGRINFGMGDVAGLTQTACNYATMLKIPQYTPNYPTGLSGISGLIGWYDSSASSTLVTSGGKVSKWNNNFNGATQGTAVMPSFIPRSNSLANAPTLLSNQSFIYGVSSGTHTAISFDGVSSTMNLETGFDNLAVNQITMFCSNKTSLFLDIVDNYPLYNIQSVNNYIINQYFDPAYQDINGVGDYFPNSSFGPNGYKEYVSMLSMVEFPITTTNIGFSINGILNYNADVDGTTWTPTQANAYNMQPINQSLTIKRPPLSQVVLGNGHDGTIFSPSFIGEILFYQGLPSQSDAQKITTYLYNRWA